MAVEFRLLGDIEARIDDRNVDVGPARRRCVLVVLLVEANRGVSVDQLIDRVWADQPPQRAREVLYSYLSRLRQTLSTTTDVRIGRQGGGYVLAVDPTAVDLHRYHQLIARARAAGDGEDAVALFEKALGLWRGSPFAALDTPWLNSVRDGLVRHRLAAELDRNDLALRRGDHCRLLVDLSAAAAAHPLDERVAGQLVLALYRSGRQGDALEVYRQMRRRLADELGVDPGPPLRHLHQQILTADPSLAAPSLVVTRPGPSSTGSSLPRQLPVLPRSFTGRTRELAQLDALLNSAGKQPAAVVISAVSGTAGIGKTALAVHWAHRAAQQFPDGQLYVNLRGFDPTGSVMDPAEAIRGFLHALHVPPQHIPAGLDAQAALYRSQLADKRILVLLDNARDAAQVRPLLPGTPACLFIVTSRNQLAGLAAADGAHPLTLDLLSLAEARDLLASRLGADRVAAEPDAVDEIVDSCARLPLALAIVAGRAATHPQFTLQALARELSDARHRLDALSDADPATDVRAVFSWSFRTLTAGAARLFRLLGLHPGPDLTAAAAASLAGLPVDQVRPVLAELTRANLLTEHIPGRYTFHDLLRMYATEITHAHDPDDDRRAAVQRLLDHYLHTAHTADRLLNPHRDPIVLTPPQLGTIPEDLTDDRQAMTWLTTEQPVLLAAVDQAAEDGFDNHTWQLAWALSTYFDLRGLWHEEVATWRVAVRAAVRLGNRGGQAQTHRGLASAYTRLGRFDDAHTHLRQALDLFRELGDRTSQAHTHLTLTWVFDQQGSYEKALYHAGQALDLYRAANHRDGQANSLNAAGWCQVQLGDHWQALASCQQALSLLQELGDRKGQAGAWDSIGYAQHQLGNHAEALASYRQALDLYRKVGDRYGEADVLVHLGDTHHAAGNLDPAHDAWQQALSILNQLDHPDAGEVRAKLNRATTSEPRS